MTEQSQKGLGQWTPQEIAAAGPALRMLQRAQVVMAAEFSLGIWLVPALIIGAAVLHNRILGAACVFLFALASATSAAVETARFWIAFRMKGWTGWKCRPIRLAEHPVAFWSWSAVHTLPLILSVAGTGLLTGLAVELIRR